MAFWVSGTFNVELFIVIEHFLVKFDQLISDWLLRLRYLPFDFTWSLHEYILCSVTWRMGLASGKVGHLLLKYFRCVSVRVHRAVYLSRFYRGDKFKLLGKWPSCSSSINTNNDNSTYSVFTISFQEPALPLSSGTGNGYFGRMQNGSTILFPVSLLLRKVVYSFDQEKFPRKFYLACKAFFFKFFNVTFDWCIY